MNRSIAKELSNCLAQMSLGNRRKRQRRRAAQAVTQMPTRRPRRKRRNNNRTPGTQGSSRVNLIGRGLPLGDVVISRSELLTVPATTVSTTLLHPSNYPWLKSLAAVFERYKYLKLDLEYRPLVGANTNGNVALGVDWTTDSQTVSKVGATFVVDSDHYRAASRSTVLALTPSVDTPLWQRVPRVVVPRALLQSRAWYNTAAPASGSSNPYDFAPGFLAAIATAKDSGEVWIHYTVHFSGTHA